MADAAEAEALSDSIRGLPARRLSGRWGYLHSLRREQALVILMVVIAMVVMVVIVMIPDLLYVGLDDRLGEPRR